VIRLGLQNPRKKGKSYPSGYTAKGFVYLEPTVGGKVKIFGFQTKGKKKEKKTHQQVNN